MNRTAIAAALAAALLLPAAAKADDAPGVFKIPGTESTIKFYGYVQLDATVDFAGRPSTIEDFDWATVLPSIPSDKSDDGKKHPQTYLTARTSRFGIQTSTPSAAGNIGVRLEGDFNGPSYYQSETYTNSVLFRLRHAYGTVGNFLVGQTWTTFLDLGAAPDTVDFNGPGSLALVRNPMIRYALPLADGMNLALALENNRGQQYGPDDRTQMIPDVHANFTMNGGWGHLSLRGVAQTYTRQVPDGADVKNKSKVGFGAAASGSAKFGGDTLVAQVAGGPGIGRYMLNLVGNEFGNAGGGITSKTHGFVTVNGEDIELWTAYAYHLGYTHVWGGGARSNIVWSQTFIQDPKINDVAQGNSTQKEMMQAFVNTFFPLAKNAEVGVEYAFGQWKSFGPNDIKGVQHRVNASFHYNFF